MVSLVLTDQQDLTPVASAVARHISSTESAPPPAGLRQSAATGKLYSSALQYVPLKPEVILQYIIRQTLHSSYKELARFNILDSKTVLSVPHGRPSKMPCIAFCSLTKVNIAGCLSASRKQDNKREDAESLRVRAL